NEEIMEKFRAAQAQIKNTIQEVEKGTEEFKKNVELEAKAAAGIADKPASTTQPAPSDDKAALAADQDSALVPPPPASPAAPSDAPADADASSAKAQP